MKIIRLAELTFGKRRMIVIFLIYLSLPQQITRDSRARLIPSLFKALSDAGSVNPMDYPQGRVE